MLGHFRGTRRRCNGGYVTVSECQGPQNFTAQRVSPDVNHELSLIIIYHYHFISSNKWATLTRDVRNGTHVGKAGACGDLCFL